MRRYLYFTADEVREMPWWQSHMYYEELYRDQPWYQRVVEVDPDKIKEPMSEVGSDPASLAGLGFTVSGG